jgi:hypothetical protein
MTILAAITFLFDRRTDSRWDRLRGYLEQSFAKAEMPVSGC